MMDLYDPPVSPKLYFMVVDIDIDGEVESQSISDQNLTKKHWEEKLAEEQEKKNSHRTPQKQNNNDWEYDNRFREEESLESDDGPKYRDDMIQYEKKVKSPEPDINDIYANESAIDREIRLATEREEHLRKERETRLLEAQQKSGGSHGTQPKPPAAKQQTPHVVRSPVKEDGRIATGDSPSSTSKMSLEYSTVEEDTEATEKRVGYEKEQQQSEFERQEKEEEKLSAHESIVEREIRLQREREEIIARERERAYQQKREEAKKKKVPTATLR